MLCYHTHIRREILQKLQLLRKFSISARITLSCQCQKYVHHLLIIVVRLAMHNKQVTFSLRIKGMII